MSRQHVRYEPLVALLNIRSLRLGSRRLMSDGPLDALCTHEATRPDVGSVHTTFVEDRSDPTMKNPGTPMVLHQPSQYGSRYVRW
jgi:hypothetical protein